MNLYAYMQIDDLEKIAKDNGIEVPRLRGYKLMSDEKPIDVKEFCDGTDVDVAERLCEAVPFWSTHPHYWMSDSWTDCLKEYYVTNGKIQWHKIHGWKRKVLKTAIHNGLVKYKKQAETFNKYVGRKDILYIHARIGGNNWKSYYTSVLNKPWFIEKVDDAFDSTYCDIYAKIKES